jgi:S-DNA-T family DNA segregation ATPase FtsK/SpoIIIE
MLAQQKVSPRAAGPNGGKRPSPKAYTFPIKGLLKDYPDGEYWEIDAETRRSAAVLMETLEEFKIKAEVTGIRKGPVITMFEILPSPGVKISRIVNLADNIALRLAASRVRIVAPIPGKHAVGIEVPNRHRAIVSFKEMVSLKDFQDTRMEIPVALGKDISGEAQLLDLTQTPHLLIAGATGSGKSVCVNSIICSILYRKSPEDVRILLIDPKIVELKAYNDIPHLLTPVVTEPKRAFQALQYCIDEMERRYSLLDNTGARDIRSYNKKASKHKLTIGKIPYWVIVIDEFADLMATTGKEMEAVLARLAAMARAVGIHLVLATQRPSIDVITGLIKANIPSRIAFMVASKFDSRIIIDSVGAEKLLGQGDMLFTPAWDPIPVRIQGTYLSEEEVEAITDHARTLGEPEYLDEEMFYDEEEEEYDGSGSEDPLMDKAIEIVLAAGKASASYIQRRLKVGYNRAARMVEEMERMGIVGPAQGSKPRDIIHAPER